MKGTLALLAYLARSLLVPHVLLLQVPTGCAGCHSGGTSSGPWSQLTVRLRTG